MRRRDFGTVLAAAAQSTAAVDQLKRIRRKGRLRQIADLGFTGYIAHECRPTPGRDLMESGNKALGIMDV
jgi:hypothetical protein